MHISKVVNSDEVEVLFNKLRLENKKIVFTNGCFDILHAGHIAYLNRAASCGDVLVLGLNSDSSIKSIKGDKRPIINQDQRSKVLSAMSCIDYIIFFDEPEPKNLIIKIQPDVLVKGADWEENQISGADVVKGRGGTIERIVFEEDISTTKIIERIGGLYYGK